MTAAYKQRMNAKRERTEAQLARNRELQVTRDRAKAKRLEAARRAQERPVPPPVDAVTLYRAERDSIARCERLAYIEDVCRTAIRRADCDAKADAEKRKRGGRPRKRISLNIVGADPKDVYGEWWGQR